MWTFIVLEIIGVACVFHLWLRRSRTSVWWKLAWSIVVLFPIAGPLAYGAGFDEPPPPHDAATRPPPPRPGVSWFDWINWRNRRR